MSAWSLGAIYKMPGGERARLVETEGTFGSEEVIGKFEALDRKTLYVVPLSKLAPYKKAADVSLRIVANAQPYLDALADIQAKLLADDGWYCISGKHLRIARVADPYVRASFERASMPDEVKADKLRRKFASTSPVAETKTVDVDTYVALKKLRRERERAARPKRTFALKPPYLDPRRETAGERHEARYIAELEALPDSLYKRIQLRYMRLPKAARRDHAARKKALDREVAKRVGELPAETVITPERLTKYLTTGEMK